MKGMVLPSSRRRTTFSTWRGSLFSSAASCWMMSCMGRDPSFSVEWGGCPPPGLYGPPIWRPGARPIGGRICRCPAMNSIPYSLFVLDKKRMGRTRKGVCRIRKAAKPPTAARLDGPREKIAFTRSGAVALRADGGLPNRCRQRLPAFCQLAPNRSFALASSHVFGGAVIGAENRMAPASEPAAAGLAADGSRCNGRMRTSAPTKGPAGNASVVRRGRLTRPPRKGPASA